MRLVAIALLCVALLFALALIVCATLFASMMWGSHDRTDRRWGTAIATSCAVLVLATAMGSWHYWSAQRIGEAVLVLGAFVLLSLMLVVLGLRAIEAGSRP